MTTLHRGSAQIYQFPAGGRAGLNGRRQDAAREQTRLPRAACGSGWYHDEAIAEDAAKPADNVVRPFTH